MQILVEVKDKGYSTTRSFHENYEGLHEPLRIVYTGDHYDALRKIK